MTPMEELVERMRAGITQALARRDTARLMSLLTRFQESRLSAKLILKTRVFENVHPCKKYDGVAQPSPPSLHFIAFSNIHCFPAPGAHLFSLTAKHLLVTPISPPRSRISCLPHPL